MKGERADTGRAVVQVVTDLAKDVGEGERTLARVEGDLVRLEDRGDVARQVAGLTEEGDLVQSDGVASQSVEGVLELERGLVLEVPRSGRLVKADGDNLAGRDFEVDQVREGGRQQFLPLGLKGFTQSRGVSPVLARSRNG